MCVFDCKHLSLKATNPKPIHLLNSQFQPLILTPSCLCDHVIESKVHVVQPAKLLLPLMSLALQSRCNNLRPPVLH